MNASHHTAIEEYKKGNFLPLTRLLRNKFKNDPELCDFLVLIVQRRMKLKPGEKPGKNEQRDRQIAARMVKLMEEGKTYLEAWQTIEVDNGYSEGTIACAYRTYVPIHKRPRSRRQS